VKVSTCCSAVALSAAVVFSGAVVLGSAEASQWFTPGEVASLADSGSQTVRTASAPTVDGNTPVQVAGNTQHLRDGSYRGPITDAYYGQVQVQANVQGGRLVSVDVLQYPADRRTSRAINSHALPILESEVVTAQSSHVDLVSGATLTSSAYLRSLNKALGQAGS